MAFWYADFSQLTEDLVIKLALKQFGINLMEHLAAKFVQGRKINKIQAHFEPLITSETCKYKKMSLQIQKTAEEQRQMAKDDKLVFYFNEACIQFGFLCLFSPCFTLAPAFSLFTNLIEISTKMQNMSRYSRKFRS